MSMKLATSAVSTKISHCLMLMSDNGMHAGVAEYRTSVRLGN